MPLPFTLASAILTSVSNLASVVTADVQDCRSEFCITGIVSYVIGYSENHFHLLVEEDGRCVDTTGQIATEPPAIGDIVRLDGAVRPCGADSIQPQFRNVTKIGQSTCSDIHEGPAAEIMGGMHDFHRSHLVGEVRDVQPSGSDPCWNYLSIISDGQLYYAPIPIRGATLGQLESLIGARVDLDGYPDSHNCSYRFLDERRFMVADLSHVMTLSPPPQDPFVVAPSINVLHRLPPEQISRLGRHKATGRVLSVWQGRNALFQLNDGRMALLDFAQPLEISRGQTAEVIGYPSTDGFLLSLHRANARLIIGTPFVEPAIVELSSQDIQNRLSDTFLAKKQLQGLRIRLVGTVADLHDSQREHGLFSLSIAGHLLDVDFSSISHLAADLDTGCRVRITGTCVLTTENWAIFSKGLQLNGIQLVLNREGDLEILQRPPWWTPQKLTILVIVLVLFLAGCLTWNRLIHRLSERRGQELFQERSANALAELKTEERTRLSVELHDSISQILTGAAMQLDAGEIGAAKRILASCRRELRNCLWDLRSHAMDAANLADAVRETIAPHIGDRRAVIDLDIPSAALSEELRHAALRIIREATANAIRHGRATTVAISGELSGKTLSFTIVDDGRGFDPSVAQGSATGHFGLLGMRERARAFNGSVSIASAPGSTTEISVILEDRVGHDFGEDSADRDETSK